MKHTISFNGTFDVIANSHEGAIDKAYERLSVADAKTGLSFNFEVVEL